MHPALEIKPCPVCASTAIFPCIDIPDVPVYCNVFYRSRDAARDAARGDLKLAACKQCGHLFNSLFDPSLLDYTIEYENSLHFSPRFQAYAENLAQNLVKRFSLYDKTVIEIACGKGDFLTQLCNLGNNKGIGFDPSYSPERQTGECPQNITFVQDYYSDHSLSHRADLICCRHALEHMEKPREFLESLHKTIGDNKTALYFEVPNSRYTLQNMGIWDIIYEHCGYFCDHSLASAFIHSGFQVEEIWESFGGQFLSIVASSNPAKKIKQTSNDRVIEVTDAATALKQNYDDKLHIWTDRLKNLKQQGMKAAVWGAGSKGVTFLNALNASDEIGCIVDINTHKKGKFTAGTGHRIVPPDFLSDYQPDFVIVMNPLYVDEVSASLREINVGAEILQG